MSSWNAEQYEGRHSYVWKWGGNVIELLQPREGERVLDLGCGTGQLAAEIAAKGAQVVGLDSSPEMLGQARQNYPHLKFVLADATDFRFEEPFDAVFSNAALHWVQDAEASVKCIAAALRPGGRFVAEFGGQGNIAEILAALRAVFGAAAEQLCPWRFRESANTQLCSKGTASKFSKPAFSTGPRRWKGNVGWKTGSGCFAAAICAI